MEWYLSKLDTDACPHVATGQLSSPKIERGFADEILYLVTSDVDGITFVFVCTRT